MNITTQKNIQNFKYPVSLSLFILLILPTIFSASSASDASNSARGTGELSVKAFASLQDRDGFSLEKELAKGRFLVADRRLKDPNFYQTVVLLIRYDQSGALGLVINRPLKMQVSTVVPDIKELAQRKDNLYLGGPVEPNKILLLLKSAITPEDATSVFADVYISSSRKDLRRMVIKADKDERFRIYAGYAGWAPKQLESERDRGDWHVITADAAILFDKKPSEVWPELIHRFTVDWVHQKIPTRTGAQTFSVKK